MAQGMMASICWSNFQLQKVGFGAYGRQSATHWLSDST